MTLFIKRKKNREGLRLVSTYTKSLKGIFKVHNITRFRFGTDFTRFPLNESVQSGNPSPRLRITHCMDHDAYSYHLILISLFFPGQET